MLLVGPARADVTYHQLSELAPSGFFSWWSCWAAHLALGGHLASDKLNRKATTSEQILELAPVRLATKRMCILVVFG